MIRKLARIDAPVEVVRDMFRDAAAWPQWMPGVASTRTLASQEDSLLLEVVILFLGRRVVQKLECRERDDRLIHRQVAGWFKKWEAVWSFRPPPEGPGTTLSLTLDADLGAAGFLLPKKFLENWMSRHMDDTIASARARAVRLARDRREPTQAVPVGLPLLQIFETADGFEVHLAGRTFQVDAWEPAEERKTR